MSLSTEPSAWPTTITIFLSRNVTGIGRWSKAHVRWYNENNLEPPNESQLMAVDWEKVPLILSPLALECECLMESLSFFVELNSMLDLGSQGGELWPVLTKSSHKNSS